MSYDRAAIAFHWVIALLITGLAIVGFRIEGYPRAEQPYWVNLHVCVGLVYALLVLCRLAWRITHPAPPLPASIDPLTRRLATAAHHLMYLLMLAIPAVGFVALVWHGRGFDYGLFKLDFGVASNRAVYQPAEGIHEKLVLALLGLAILHALVALYHQYVRRDGVLGRMIPWLNRSSLTQ